MVERTWVPCKENLPETSENKIVTYDNGDVGTAYLVKRMCTYNGHIPIIQTNVWVKDDDEAGDILAWMDLPEPYHPTVIDSEGEE